MILVAGGSGRLGTLVCNRLTSRDLEVRVMTRDPQRARHLREDAGIEIVCGDVRDRASIERAMRGVATVVSAVHGFAGPGRVTPASVDRAGNANLIDVAAAAGADVVMMSVVGAAPDNSMELFRAKYDAEQHLLASGTQWTIVRSTAFVELWADILAKAPVLGHGENPINFVSVVDVAAVVERAVIDGTLRGHILEVGGPQNLTFNEVAAVLQESLGRHGRVRHIPRPLLRALAPLSRRARAAFTMDTREMTFDAAASRADFADLPMTDVATALALSVSAAERSRNP
jgi:NADH dehydrogenase